MATQFLDCPHPLLLPILMIDYGIDLIMEYLMASEERLIQVETQTGFAAIIPGLPQPTTTDYQDLVRSLGEQHSFYSSNETAIKSLQLSLDVARTGLRNMDDTLPRACKDTLQKSSSKLRQRIEYLANALEHARIFGNFSMRLQAQQQVVSRIQSPYLFKVSN